MKKIITTIITALLLSSSLSASNDKVYAIVNGDNITAQSIAIALKDPKANFEALDENTKKNILGKIIEQKLLAQNALKTDIINTVAYKDTLRNLTQDLAMQAWIQEESKKINISEATLKKYYDRNKNSFIIPVFFKARHILVKTDTEAIDIIKTLSKSSDLKSNFIQLAKTKSVGPSGSNGGDLGFFSPDKMVPAFSNATAELKVGTISKNPVKTQFGYHVIFLEDKKESRTSTFKEVKKQISQKLGQEKLIDNINTLVTKLKKDATIIYK